MPKTREPLIAHLQGREKRLASPFDRPNGSPSSACTRACSPATRLRLSSDQANPQPPVSSAGCSTPDFRASPSPVTSTRAAGTFATFPPDRSIGCWRSPTCVTADGPRLKSPGGACFRLTPCSIIRRWPGWGPSGRRSLASSSSGSDRTGYPAGSMPAAPGDGSSTSPSGCRWLSSRTGPSSSTSTRAWGPEASSITGGKPTGSFGKGSGRGTAASRWSRWPGSRNISTVPEGGSSSGQPAPGGRPPGKRLSSGRLSPMPIGTPSNAMAASMPSWIRSTRRPRKRQPGPGRE